jgi:hypothetical protein
MRPANLLAENENLYGAALRAVTVPTPLCLSHSVAITTQQYCSVNNGKNLIG